MQSSTFFPYSWHLDDTEDECTVFRIYGLNEENRSVCCIINDFTPYVYLELPSNIEWNETRAMILGNKIDEMCGKSKPINKSLQLKKKLFYANVVKTKVGYKHRLYPFLLCSFATAQDRKSFCYRFSRPIKLLGIGDVRIKVHEQDAEPMLQFRCLRKIPTAGWINFKGRIPIPEERLTTCDYEYIVRWKSCGPNTTLATVPRPYTLSFDIEVNSSNPSTMPQSHRPNDKIFQISCVFGRQGCDSKEYDKILLTLGEPDHKVVGEDVEIQMFDTEADLLMGFTDLLHEHNPQCIVGYNILGFDIPYMSDRAKHNLCFDYDKQGYLVGKHARERVIKWSSSAYGNQEFQFLDAEGRLFIDLLPLIRRDYKFSNYKLKTVSEFFLGESKDPLNAQGIFKCYRIGMSESPEAQRAMGIVGKYCVQDSALVLKLFDTIETWVGLVEMARTCGVPIFSLYTQGQQIKVFSQVYNYCLEHDFIVERDGYTANALEQYTGATVLDPIPGVYDKVVPFDFSSLYPTTIIANNIDFSTLVVDDRIPDSDCNVIEWDDHIGCEHDTTSRTTKVANISCTHHRYRFLSYNVPGRENLLGVMPTLLKNLLDARKVTKGKIKDLKKELKSITDEVEIDRIQRLIVVLDKRQLAFKVSANSMYGAMGVKKGYLPFLPGAMCTTARGRQYIELAKNTLEHKYKAQIVYGDTDSCYVHFPEQKTAQDLWDHCLAVEKGILDDGVFPKPMKLAFEEVIYWRFFILTKKRYMSLACGRDGVIGESIEKKGVLLARRDNSKWVRDTYAKIIHMIFDREPKEKVCNTIIDEFNKVCAGTYCQKDFIVTKSVGEVSDYKIRELPTDQKKLSKRLAELNFTQEVIDIFVKDTSGTSLSGKEKILKRQAMEQYTALQLPAQVQLAERMRRRGQRVDAGSRIEYLVTTNGGPKAKQSEKLEDPEYQSKYSNIIHIDYLYYIKNLINPLDQALEVAYGLKKFTDSQHKSRLKKYTVETSLTKRFNPELVFESE
jgi:DNA polymerase elongation subunit (family B)